MIFLILQVLSFKVRSKQQTAPPININDFVFFDNAIGVKKVEATPVIKQ